MVDFVLGVGVGVVGMMAKDKFLGNGSDQQLQSKQREIDDICAENEKFRKRNIRSRTYWLKTKRFAIRQNPMMPAKMTWRMNWTI